MTPDQENKLAKDGFFTTWIDLTLPDAHTILNYCNGLTFEPIFLQVGGKMDEHREQAHMTRCNAKKRLMDAVNVRLNHLCDKWEIKEVSVLRSTPGGLTQGIHRDMSMEVVKKAVDQEKFPPVGILVALMPDTKIRVYSGCFGGKTTVDIKRQKDVTLDVAECIIFRGDLAHCGLGYETENVRVHFAVGVSGFKWIPNQTHSVEIESYHCEFCGKASDTLKKQRKHESWCRKNPDKSRVDATRQRYRELNTTSQDCPECGRHFELKNSLRKHVRTRHPEVSRRFQFPVTSVEAYGQNE